MRGVAGYVAAVLDEVFPSVVGRGVREAGDWRPDAVDMYCPRCGATAGFGSIGPKGCAFCVDTPIHWDRITRLSEYREPMDGWVKSLKFGRQWTWGPWLGEQLAGVVGEPFDATKVVVGAVPMPWQRRWGRGFNQATLMAKSLAEARGWPCVELLRRTRHTQAQTRVPPSQRAANVRGAFAVLPVDLSGWEVLLVDDVKTTGATLSVCSRLLKGAGARSVHVAVAAVADPKGRAFTAL